MKSNQFIKISSLIGSILVLVFLVSCRTTPKSASSKKPVIPNFKLITQLSYTHGFPMIYIPKNEHDHFLMLEDRAGLIVNLDRATCEPYAVSNIKDFDEKYRYANELRRIDLDKVGLKINVELKGKTDSYKMYSFSEGWSPIPNTIRSNTLEAFTGEFKVMQYKEGREISLIIQRAKNWLPDHVDRRLMFVGNYNYLVYLDEEKEGTVRVYVIEL